MEDSQIMTLLMALLVLGVWAIILRAIFRVNTMASALDEMRVLIREMAKKQGVDEEEIKKLQTFIKNKYS